MSYIRKTPTNKTEGFIGKAVLRHGDRYSYDNTVYTLASERVIITCKEHGDFTTSATSHLSGSGCQECNRIGISKRRAGSVDAFVTKARMVHGDKYSYKLTEYKNSASKVSIVCPHHGTFLQTPNSHVSGHGCPKCFHSELSKSRSADIVHFIEKAHETHGNLYSYEKSTFVNYNTPLVITCTTHGDFSQKPSHHVDGSGCPACSTARNVDLCRKTSVQFIKEAVEVHGASYDYSKVDYIDSNSKVEIICNQHGIFRQAAASHLCGRGCPKCAKSGYNQQIAGCLYVLQCGDITKIGITNRAVAVRVKEVSKSFGSEFEIRHAVWSQDGAIALSAETALIQILKSTYKSPIAKFDGSTECFLNVNLQELLQDVERKFKERNGTESMGSGIGEAETCTA